MERLKETLKNIEEASPVKVTELPPDRQAFIKKFKLKITDAFDGINGYIIMFENMRLPKATVTAMTSDKNFRWIEGSKFDKNRMSIGF